MTLAHKTRAGLSRDKASGPIYLFLLVALGAQTMIVELAIPRLLAPAFGNTLYCWTAIITVVLVALSAGYYVGGRMAARGHGSHLVSVLSSLSALWVVGIAFMGASVTSLLSPFGLMAGPLITASVLAAFPAGCGAAVIPLVVETRSEQAGEAAGQCYAWSTVGSVFGVLLTGYVLLPQFGISGAMMTGAVVVFLVVLMRGPRLLGLVGLIAVSGWLFSPKTEAEALFDKSNGYHRIRIAASPQDQNVRALYLDSTREGAVRLGSSDPVLGYQKNVRQFVETIPRLSHALFIGGGAFTLPRYIKASFPHAVVDVVELDPDVVDSAYKYLELGSDVNVLVGDGRQVLRSRDVIYDLIVNDAFNGFRKIPFHLVSREFNGLVKRRLSPEGVYAVNVIGHAAKSSLVASVLRTLMKEFENVSLFRRHKGNIWILASQTSVTPGDAPPKEKMGGQVLTDNHSPVEFLIVKDLIRAQLR
ncbi:MAG: fused MFS/spermidine synthase [Thermodesulfobacteriota bacterium]|nr:fused MFS/spermidine synthase [Thermodesulfobacteriota bacterium]